MANFSTSYLSDIIGNLEGLEKNIGEIQDEMLEAAGTEFEKAWKNGIERHEHVNSEGDIKQGYVDTGDMRDSVKFKVSKKNKTVTIAPTGKDRKGVRNALKAFVLHYGSTKIAGDRFVDDVEEKGEDAAIDAMMEVYNEELNKKGVT